ncbi:MAG: hypothetical protein AMJ75_07285 [Phycisphaerae bacterium SM1_79]|nr:MAG: hypothetical protein AMJ75_07285 [Phycisphaerae bacterium SM1_79]
MRSTVRSLTCLIIFTTFLGLPNHLDIARVDAVAFSGDSTVLGIIVTEKPLANTLIWDTVSPFTGDVDLRGRSNWKAVPTNLLMLEDDPTAATSDPGYHGREYEFKGDAVVENGYLIAVFLSAEGKVVVYSKGDSGGNRVEIGALELKGEPASISLCRIMWNTGEEAGLEVAFSGRGKSDECSAIFSFDRKQIVEIKPGETMKGISIHSPIEYGIVPGFISDDLIFDAREYPTKNALCVPAENIFVGLLEGENSMLVVTWPDGKQQMKLVPGNKQGERRLIESIDFENDGKSFYFAMLGAGGIWHKEELKPSFLEKDVAVDWKKPFAAKWKTQLLEAGVRTTYNFRESEGRIWRAITGRYTYPVWFKGEDTFYHLSKKIPPKGESIIYFLERRNTPVWVCTPVDIMKETLGRQACEDILDIAGRKLRTHHRRAGQGVRRAATCGCTAAIEVVFKAGKEVEQKDYVAGAVDDMVYFVTRHVERIGEYRDFARDMMSFLNLQRKSNPDLKAFLDGMETITQQIPQEYDRQKENIKSLEYAAELAGETKALTQKKDPKNLKSCLALGEKWRAMGGAQDELLGKYHSITRKLFQEAGYGCVNQPEAVDIAEQIRSRCRKCLRNPDGYEIWADY